MKMASGKKNKTYSNVIGKAFYWNFNAFFLHRGNAFSQYHFQNSFLKNAEFKFTFLRVNTWYSVMDHCFLTSFGIKTNDQSSQITD